MHGLYALLFLALVPFMYASDDEEPSFNVTITSRFNKLSLAQFLKTKPDLYKSKPVTKKQLAYYKSTMGSLSAHPTELLQTVSRYSRNGRNRQFKVALPRHFDARQKWPNCRSITTIMDQSRCANCWAFAAAAVFSDRICIATRGQHQPIISSTDLVNCCQHCFSDGHNGCSGGFPFKAWKHLIGNGAVTGSSYRNHTGCVPYEFPACNPDAETHTIDPGCQYEGYHTGKCIKQCQPGYSRSYNQDKYYANKVVHPKSIYDIQLELWRNGPVELRMEAYEDLIGYQGGIYYHRYGSSIGTHSVRVVGWGEENGVPYWTIANSWNNAWGDRGFFKIARGLNECKIESEAVTGYVDLKRLPRP